MNDSQANNNDLQDRLADRVLAEVIGGETPPDLSEAIASRAEEQQVMSPGVRTSRRAWVTLLATAASLMLTVMVFRDADRRGQAEPIALITTAEKEAAGDETVESALMVEMPELAEGSSREGARKVAEADEKPEPSAEAPDSVTDLSSTKSPPPVSDSLAAKRWVVQPGSVLDPRKLRESERRLGASTVFNATPAQGPTPKLSYEPSPELRARFKRQSLINDAAATPQAAPTAGVPIVDSYRWGRRQAPAAGDKHRGENRYAADARPQFLGGGGGLGGGADDAFFFEDRAGGGTYGGRFAVPGYPRQSTFGFSDAEHRRWPEPSSRDRYATIQENAFIKPIGEEALSTFSIDVDTASYSNVRQYLLNQKRLPPGDAVRVEELVNYFDYGYAGPAAGSEEPFAASMEVALCPWKPEHRLVRIGIKGREVKVDKRPLSNLVFLIDVSGSMNHRDKLPLVVAGLEALTDRLGENDRVAIVVYAGSEGVVLPSTSGEQKDAIRSALSRLQAGGSTAGGAGLKLAYEIAERNHIPGGVNRVVLCTDGDFNVGLTGTEELAQLVETRAKETKVFLTVLGFGRGNLNDAMLETISGRGEGYYAYIDNEKEARRVLSRNLSGTLVMIAKDVKLQVEFNPAKVASYRLIGYENRVLAAKDFNDDTKDAGEIGAGHTVTALYEVVPVGVKEPVPAIDGLKYQTTPVEDDAARIQLTLEADELGESLPISTELLTLKIRYKQPEGGASKKLEFPLESESESIVPASEDFRWAAAVAEFGMRLRGSRYVGEGSFDAVLERAREAIGDDEGGYRAEFLDIVRRAGELSGR